jgi:Na+-driven multidrug efflux pump
MTIYITGKAMTWALFVVIIGIILCYHVLKGVISAMGVFFKFLQEEGENHLSEIVNIFIKTLIVCLLIAIIFFAIQYLFEKVIN